MVESADGGAGSGPAGQGDPGQRRRRGRATDGAAVGSFAQHRRGLAAALPQRGTRWPAHQGTGRPPAEHQSGQGAGSHQRDAAHAQGRDPLERATAGQGAWAFGSHRASHLEKYGLQPHRVETFKFSRDPQFDFKLADITGLYLDPPERAPVLCVDEKSQIQALNRTQPALPMWPGLPTRMTHDYTRHGTTSLFAALEVASGKVHGRCYRRHRHLEFIAFLESLARGYPKLELHLICDNYGTHKHPAVKRWLAAHPRFHLHFTPTSASWLNLVERWFALITSQAIRRGSFDSTRRLEQAIMRWLERWNQNAKPFRWTKSAADIKRSLANVTAIYETRH